MNHYGNMTDAELRAAILTGNCHIGLAEGEAVKRFCDTESLISMRKSLERAESLMALIEHYSAEANSCLDEIKDALQRATE